ncbi:MAG: hypothetical protein ACRD1P_06935 [Thermoanaerobaculia bacterium]
MTEKPKKSIPMPLASAISIALLPLNWWLRVTTVRLYVGWFVAAPFGIRPIDQLQAFGVVLFWHVLRGYRRNAEKLDGYQIVKSSLTILLYYLNWLAIGWVAYHAFFSGARSLL